jgi:UDP-glucose 4-epimerase
MVNNALTERFLAVPVLVTGGAGFIGSHVVERLVTLGAYVTVVDNLQAGRWENLKAVEDAITICEVDVRDREAIQSVIEKTRPRYTFHLAANASVPNSVQDPVYDFETNSVGTFWVLEAHRRLEGCERVLVASSGAVYGEPTTFPVDENTPIKPISPYGFSKLNAEVTAQMMYNAFQVPTVIARLANVYGPRMSRYVILDFLKKLQRDPSRLEVLGTGRQVRSFTYIADAVEALLFIAAYGECCLPYNVSSETSNSIAELAEAVIAARGLTGKTRIEYTGTSWPGDAQRYEVAAPRLRALGYRPRYSLEEGLRETIAWFDATYGPTAI